MAKLTTAILGAGRVGSSVGNLLRRADYEVRAVAARTMASAERAAAFIGGGKPTTDVIEASREADIVIITTPDRVIKEVCDTIASAGAFKSGAIVVHMSGAHSLDLLISGKNSGAFRAVLHPLQSLASKEEGIKTLPGSYFRIEADSEAVEYAKNIVRALGGIELVLPMWSSDKESTALYHAGAVVVSNYFVALVDYGLKFYQSLGADKQEALRAVLPLIRGTLNNIEKLGTLDALTGPIMRGDTQTVQDHLEAMRKRTPELIGLYKALARQTIAAAKEKGSIDQQKAAELLDLVKGEPQT